MPSFYSLIGVPSTGFDPSHAFTTSWLIPPLALGLLRLLLSTYCFVTIFTIWGWEGTHHLTAQIGKDFSYFTSLTYWGLSFYLLVAGFHTLVYGTKGYSWLERWPRPLQALHSLYYTTIVTYPFLVTIVYWAIIYSSPWFQIKEQAWSNISRHALNSAFALGEVILPATSPPPWLHIVLLILILLFYLAVAYITYAAQGFFVYNFLNFHTHSNGIVTGYCFGIFAGILVIFLVVWALIWLRKRFTGAGKRSKKDVGRNSVETYRTGNSHSYHARNGDMEMLSNK